MCRRGNDLCIGGPFGGYHADHIRNDFAGFLHNHAVIQVDILTGNFIKIVQTGPVHLRATDKHRRLKFRHGGDCPRFSHLKHHAR